MDLLQIFRNSTNRISETFINTVKQEYQEIKNILLNPPVRDINLIRNNIPIVPRFHRPATINNNIRTSTTRDIPRMGSSYFHSYNYDMFNQLFHQIQENLSEVTDDIDVRTPVSNEILIHLKAVNANYVPQDISCPICLEIINNGINNGINHDINNDIRDNGDYDIIELPCKHYFHKHCINEWLARSTSCPVCKKEIDDISYSDSGALNENNDSNMAHTNDITIGQFNNSENMIVANKLKLRLRNKNGHITCLTVSDNISVLQLMNLFKLDVNTTKLVFLTKVLDNSKLLCMLDLKDGDLLVECS